MRPGDRRVPYTPRSEHDFFRRTDLHIGDINRDVLRALARGETVGGAVGTQQHVGSGSNQYVFPGMSPDGGKLIIHANSAAEANQVVNFVKGLRGGPTNTQIIQGLPGGGHELQGYYPAQPQDMGGYDSGGGGYDGGGYGGGNLPPRQLATSPEWLAYLNALGLEESQFRADIDRQRAFAKSAAEQQLLGLVPQYDKQRRGIAHGSEAAGMSRSGGLLKGLADSRASQGRDESNINQALGSTLSGLESQLAQRMMDLGARKAQQELSLRASGYV